MVLGPIQIAKSIVLAVKNRPIVNTGRILWAILQLLTFLPLGAIIVRIRRLWRKIQGLQEVSHV